MAAELEGIWRANRPLLVDIAFRMVGDIGDAEDLVQEAFTRLLSAPLDEIRDVRGWLIVVVSRLCFDLLGSARVRRSAPAVDVESVVAAAPDPADVVTLDDSVRLALLAVLRQLSPAERAVFVLHDVFQMSFEDIAEVVGRSPAACRQLASRSRRHVQASAGPARFQVEPAEHRRIADRFIAACATGDVEALTALLDPSVGGVVDLGEGRTGSVQGRETVIPRILVFFGGATGATLVSQWFDGHPGVFAFRERQLVGILTFDVEDGRIADIHGMADPRRLATLTPFVSHSGAPRRP
jgi:RNA polymerase sigma-70 factor (ECF subfamily)